MALTEASSPKALMAAARSREEAFLAAEHAAGELVRRAESRLAAAARELARAQERYDRRAAEVAAAQSTLRTEQDARARGDVSAAGGSG